MKVLLLTEGGAGIGFGHISRCAAIRQAFIEKGAAVEFFVNGDEGIAAAARREGFRLLDWLRAGEGILKVAEGADITLVDSYLAGPEVYRSIARTARLSVYMDDSLRLSYPDGIVVNGALLAEGLEYPRRTGIEYLLGPEFFPLRKEFWEAPPLSVRERIENILVTFGGADEAGMTAVILEALARGLPDVRKTVVVGGSFKSVREIEKACDRHSELVRSPDAEGMREAMLGADLAVSSGGQTLYELARVGLPAVALMEAPNQSNNVRGWEKAGFCIFAGDCADPGAASSVLEAVHRLKSRESRAQRSLLGRKAMDGNGARRLVGRLLDAGRSRSGSVQA